MENDRKTISAGEINKFVYCPYQWYYTRVYGNKKLRELVKIRNERYGYENSGFSNFERGNDFHSRYHSRYKLKRAAILTLCILCSIMIAAVILWVMGYE